MKDFFLTMKVEEYAIFVAVILGVLALSKKKDFFLPALAVILRVLAFSTVAVILGGLVLLTGIFNRPMILEESIIFVSTVAVILGGLAFLAGIFD